MWILLDFLAKRTLTRFYTRVGTPKYLVTQPIENQVNIVTTLVTRIKAWKSRNQWKVLFFMSCPLHCIWRSNECAYGAYSNSLWKQLFFFHSLPLGTFCQERRLRFSDRNSGQEPWSFSFLIGLRSSCIVLAIDYEGQTKTKSHKGHI